MFALRKIWGALFSCNTRFEIRPFALLPMLWSLALSEIISKKHLDNTSQSNFHLPSAKHSLFSGHHLPFWNSGWSQRDVLGRPYVMFWPATLLKLTLLHGCFSCFLNCINGTKSRNASHMHVKKLLHSALNSMPVLFVSIIY